MNVVFALTGLSLVLYKGTFLITNPTLSGLIAKLPQSKITTTLPVLNISSECHRVNQSSMGD